MFHSEVIRHQNGKLSKIGPKLSCFGHQILGGKGLQISYPISEITLPNMITDYELKKEERNISSKTQWSVSYYHKGNHYKM